MVSVHSYLALLNWVTVMEQNLMVQVWQWKAVCLITDRKQEKQKWLG